MDLDEPNLYENIDSTQVQRYLIKFSDQINESNILVNNANIPRIYDVKRIIIAGNGHNALAGLLLQSYLKDKSHLPISIEQTDKLPKWVNKHTLIIFISYSGEDIETLCVFKEAIQKHCKIIGISSTGHLKEYCLHRNLPFIEIPENHSSRISIAFLFFIALYSIMKTGLLQMNLDSEINECKQILIEMNKTIGLDVPLSQNPAKQIATSVSTKIPLIFSWDIFSPIASYWSMLFNQNSKISSHSYIVPHCTHHAIVGWANQKQSIEYYSLILRDHQLENKEMKKRLQFLERFFIDLNIDHQTFSPDGKYNLSKIFSLIYLGLYTSYYTAILSDIDPGPTPIIHQLKETITIA